jgi:hypothetical protein
MTRLLFALILSCSLVTAASARTLEMIEGAYELTLGDVAMPRSEVGTAFFRSCPTCKTNGLRVTAQTHYLISNRELPYADFLRAVEDLRRRAGGNRDTGVGIFYDLGSNQITRIAVFPPD